MPMKNVFTIGPIRKCLRNKIVFLPYDFNKFFVSEFAFFLKLFPVLFISEELSCVIQEDTIKFTDELFKISEWSCHIFMWNVFCISCNCLRGSGSLRSSWILRNVVLDSWMLFLLSLRTPTMLKRSISSLMTVVMGIFLPLIKHSDVVSLPSLSILFVI